MARLHIHTDALDQARRDLGLKLDVRVIFDRLTCKGGDPDVCVQGWYSGIDPFHGWHNVYVHKYLTTTAASAVLWHELTHAVQCERIGSWPRWDAEYQRQAKAVPARYGTKEYFEQYKRLMPLEVEAWSASELARCGALEVLTCSAECGR